jgi:hypothetical protein
MVKLIRLITGEEIIATIISSDDNTISFENPIRIVVIPGKSAPNNPTIGFAPWAEFTDDKLFSIDRRNVLAIMNPIQQFVDQYKATFSKIIQPQSSGIILPG